jgi:hypothetical protein
MKAGDRKIVQQKGTGLRSAGDRHSVYIHYPDYDLAKRSPKVSRDSAFAFSEN